MNHRNQSSIDMCVDGVLFNTGSFFTNVYPTPATRLVDACKELLPKDYYDNYDNMMRLLQKAVGVMDPNGPVLERARIYNGFTP